MRLNRPQSLHSNTICPPLPENAGTCLSKPFEHPNTNQNSGSNPSILRKSFAKAPSFFLKHGVNRGKQGLFFSQRPYFLSPSCGRCVLHGRSSSQQPNGDISTAHGGRKKAVRFGRDRGNCFLAARVAPRSRRFLRLLPLVGRRSGEHGDTKTPAARKHSADGRFSRRGRKSKKVILCLQAE